ncbi:hypothetical protein MHYP_G00118530 [Metynnis hypsauchen]
MKSILSALKKEVPFREAPAVCSGRGRPQQLQTGRSTLAAPRVLLRSNSDNNLNVNKLPEARSPSRSPSPLRSLSPRRPQQMQNSPNGTVKTMGRGSRPPRSRSPSLGRLGEGDTRRHTPQRHSRSVTAFLPKGGWTKGLVSSAHVKENWRKDWCSCEISLPCL